MNDMLRQWIELVRSFGASLVEVYKAEAGELKRELLHTSEHLAWALGFFVAAAVVGFWTLAAGIYFAIQLLAIWLPLWGASGVVLLLLLGVIALLGFLGYRRLQKWESPGATMGRRLQEHREWLEGSLLPPEEPAAREVPGADDDEPRQVGAGEEER